jgi:hypothetical protein
MSSTGHGHKCCHESLGDLTPVDVYFGRGQIISLKREMIKKQTIEKNAACYTRRRLVKLSRNDQEPSLTQKAICLNNCDDG